MTKKIEPLRDYISASVAANILSVRLQRPVRPGYVHKLRNVRFVRVSRTTNLYHKADIEKVTIRRHEKALSA